MAEAIVGLSSYQSYLMIGTGESDNITWEKLIDIKQAPAIGGEPERIDITTLSHGSRVYTLGIQDTESMTPTANFTPENYQKIKNLKGQVLNLAFWFGADVQGSTVTPDGRYGKFTFKGEIDCYKNEVGVNEAQDMTVVIVPSTEPEFTVESGTGSN